MTALMYASCAIGFVLFCVYIAISIKEKNIKGVCVKGFVSVAYLLVAAFGTLSNPDALLYGIPVIIAGVLGLKGDIYLEQKWMYKQHHDDYLRIGFICFGMGHLFYIWALHQRVSLSGAEYLIPVAGGLLMFIGNLVMEKPTKQDFGKFRWFVGAYAFVLGYSTALSVLIYFKTGAVFSLMFALGCVSFMASDLVLSQIYFGKNKATPTTFVVNMVAYYLAQFLIALTPAFVK